MTVRISTTFIVAQFFVTACASRPANQYEYRPGYLENVSEITALEKILIDNESHTFAGLFISRPECYCLTALFKSDGKALLEKYTTSTIVEVGVAKYSLDELKEIKADTLHKLKILGIALDSVEINVRHNGVDAAIQGNTMSLQKAKKLISEASIELHPAVRLSDVYWDEI